MQKRRGWMALVAVLFGWLVGTVLVALGVSAYGVLGGLSLLFLAVLFGYYAPIATESTPELKATDKQTGLPHRGSFLSTHADFHKPALLLLNIDRFREINDFYGHEVGDFFIAEMAKILQFYLPENPRSVLFRLGVDEFGIVLEDPASDAALALAEQIVEAIPKESVFYEDFEISCTMSIGIAQGESRLLEKADMALTHARQRSHHRLALYTVDMDESRRYQSNLTWARKIHDAIIQDRVIPYFQAIYETQSGKVYKHEALIRIIDEDGQILSPFSFLQAAHLSKQYGKLSRLMMRQTFAFFATRDDRFSVNLSIDDITNTQTVSFIEDQIRRYDLGDRVTFEILESEEIEDYEHTHGFIMQMRQMGCRFAIDDFGSGYSNFINITRLEVDYLKIDASLIRAIDTCDKSYLIVKSIVQFARLLNLKTVAEHVHNQAIIDRAKELGIDYLQGYALSKPAKEPTL